MQSITQKAPPAESLPALLDSFQGQAGAPPRGKKTMISLTTARAAEAAGPSNARDRELLDAFAQVAALTAAPKEVRGRLRIVRRFGWGKSITRAAIEDYLIGLRRRGLAERTIRNHHSALSTWCEFLMTRGLLALNPCRGVKLRRLLQPVPRWLDDDELATVRRLARAHGVWVEVSLALCTGLRLSELIRLRWEHINFDRRCLMVYRSKSGRPRVVPLSKPAMGALRTQRRRTGGFEFVFPARRTWRGGWRYEDHSRKPDWWFLALRPIQRAVPKFTEGLAAKATGRGWHLFRHTFASRAVQAGVSLYVVSGWLGHSGVQMTQRYAHLQAQYDRRIELAAPPG